MSRGVKGASASIASSALMRIAKRRRKRASPSVLLDELEQGVLDLAVARQIVRPVAQAPGAASVRGGAWPRGAWR
jgi:hypothetical protein